jgi:hypothetical protein
VNAKADGLEFAMSENPGVESRKAAGTKAFVFAHGKNEGYRADSNAIPPSLKSAPILLGSLLVGFTLFLGGVTFAGTGEPVLSAFISLMPVVILGVPLILSIRRFRGGQLVSGTLGVTGASKVDVTTGTINNLKHQTVEVMGYEFIFTSPVTGLEIHGKEVTREFRYQGPVAGDTVAVYFVNDKNFTLL